jgi:arsenite methyltransferase
MESSAAPVPAPARLSAVTEYYGETLQSTADLKTSACCPVDSAPPAHRAILERVHPEVRDRFYGCGSPIPDAINGATVLDLGCGTGRDVYLASALVGKEGKVVGVDMTQEQLDVAERHVEYHAKELLGEGAESNVIFRKGVIEDLAAAGVEDASVDVVISNCVCNLSPDKPAVFREVARVLREGGEFYFSDIYTDRRLSAAAREDDELVGECLGGALYIQDFRRVMAGAGLPDVRVVSAAPVVLHDERMLALVPGVRFFSVTVRAFKVKGLEDRAENYGQTATYTGCCGSGQKFDARFHFPKDVAVSVDANTAMVLKSSRYQKRFEVTEAGAHKGLFDGGVEGGFVAMFLVAKSGEVEAAAGCCPPVEETAATGASCCPPAEAKAGSANCCPPTSEKANANGAVKVSKSCC